MPARRLEGFWRGYGGSWGVRAAEANSRTPSAGTAHGAPGKATANADPSPLKRVQDDSIWEFRGVTARPGVGLVQVLAISTNSYFLIPFLSEVEVCFPPL